MKKLLIATFICCLFSVTAFANNSVNWLNDYDFATFDNSGSYIIADSSDIFDYKGNLVVSLKNLPFQNSINQTIDDVPVFEVLDDKNLILTGTSSRGNSQYFGIYDFNRKQIIEPKYTTGNVYGNLFLGKYYSQTNENTYFEKLDIYNLDGKLLTFSDEISNFILLSDNKINLITSNETSIIIDFNGKILANYNYIVTNNYGNILTVKKDSKYGLISSNGDILLDINYNNISNFNDDVCIATNDTQSFLVNSSGKFIKTFANKLDLVDVKNNMFIAQINSTGPNANESFGVLNKNGDIVIDHKYEFFEFLDDNFIKATKYNYVTIFDENYKVLFGYDQKKENILYNGYLFYRINGENISALDKKGNLIKKYTNSSLQVYDDFDLITNLKTDITYKVSKNNLNSVKISNYITQYIGNGIFSYFNENLNRTILITEQGRTYDFGFYSIEPQIFYTEHGYNYQTSFSNNMILVKKDNKFGILTNPLIVNVDAKYNTSEVIVNGKKISFESYNILGNNYFKLRDLAEVLNGTASQFNIEWLPSDNLILVTTNSPYKTGSGAISSGNFKNKQGILTNSNLKINDLTSNIRSYNIAGNNYFKLRDLAKIFNFTVSWNEKTNTIEVNT